MRNTPDVGTTDWRAVCGKTARAVRREGRQRLSYPLRKSILGDAAYQLGSSPHLLAREPSPRYQRFEFCPHDRGVDAAIERPLRKAAVGTRDHVLATQQFGEAYDTLCDKFRMFHHI